jgi:hypothetical protein
MPRKRRGSSISGERSWEISNKGERSWEISHSGERSWEISNSGERSWEISNKRERSCEISKNEEKSWEISNSNWENRSRSNMTVPCSPLPQVRSLKGQNHNVFLSFCSIKDNNQGSEPFCFGRKLAEIGQGFINLVD